jgi:hypothetical protein
VLSSFLNRLLSEIQVWQQFRHVLSSICIYKTALFGELKILKLHIPCDSLFKKRMNDEEWAGHLKVFLTAQEQSSHYIHLLAEHFICKQHF